MANGESPNPSLGFIVPLSMGQSLEDNMIVLSVMHGTAGECLLGHMGTGE